MIEDLRECQYCNINDICSTINVSYNTKPPDNKFKIY